MKIISILPIIVLAREDLPPAEPQIFCYNACQTVESCKNDPHAHSTYCKYWLSIPVCFGLYWESEDMTSMCYQPNDASCGDRFPVICDSQATTIAPVMKETTPPDSGQTSTVEPTPDISTEPTSSVPSPPQSTGPSGEYCGSVDSTVKLGIRLGFDGQTASLTLSEFIKGTISGLLYTYNESTKLVQIQPTLEYQNFLAALPLVLVPEDVVVTYDPSADRVSGTVLGISIPATKDAC